MRLRRRSALVAGIIALAAGLLPAVPAGAQEKVTLRLNLKAGQSYAISTTTRQQITQTIAGNAQTLNQTLTFTYSLKPSKVDADGTIHGAYTCDAVAVKMATSAGQVDYDSSRDKAEAVNPMAKPYAAVVGTAVQITITPLGEVKELTGADKVVAAAAEAAAALPREQMEAQFGEKAQREGIEQLTRIYPVGPVAVGDSWEVEQKMTAAIAGTSRSTYTLKSLTGGKATLDVKGTATTEADAPTAIVPGGKFDLKGTQTGSLVLDQSTGWIASGSVTSSTEGKLALDVGGQQMEIPMKIKSDITVGRAKAPPAKK